MPKIIRTKLPGVGVRHEITTRGGSQLGVLTHRNGDRELLFYDPSDPDTCRDAVRLEEEEAHILGELLGATEVVDSVEETTQDIEGLTLDWAQVPVDAPAVGRTIGEIELRTRTGVSIIAVLRGEETIPAPTPEHRIAAEETLVLVGTAEGVAAAERLMLTG